MVLLGAAVGGSLGKLGGHAIGNLVGGGRAGEIIEDIGAGLGGFLGALSPFKKGGKVKKTGPAYVHKGEVVLPVKTVKDLGRLFHTSPHHMVTAKGHVVKHNARKHKARK